ncbi:hypothetical protein [Cohnella massiliensis]|uniref:hypothetical protein n=1 Tax=Cohnella massiliensis TaxID=1816691 RepID=UPI001593E84B|nr:hypothetical protein [Cohnella massiliensis]
MTIVNKFEVVKSEWENEDGEYLYTITDGVDEKGQFRTREEAIENMERIILNWRADS